MSRPTQRSSVPIRWRLALTSAGMTFAILLLFALVIGAFTTRRLQSDFDHGLRDTAGDLQNRIHVHRDLAGDAVLARDDLVEVILQVAATGNAAVRVVDTHGRVIAPLGGAPNLGKASKGVHERGDYRVVSEPLYAGTFTPVAYLQYGKLDRGLQKTTTRVEVFLAVGVLGGTLLALLAGLAVAGRAMAPVGRLTGAAKEIARTRDPAVRLPHPRSEDEVADLSRTLDTMLMALAEARAESEATLARQREFVADASHELRTPLTSVLANLELLEASLAGEDREVAAAALRSSRRMRRLVADLLLLARADAGRAHTLVPVDLAAVVRDAAGEVATLAEERRLAVESPAPGEGQALVAGSADELHRLALNLLENAVVHTPAGTSVRAAVGREDGEVVLEVADDGPGVPSELRAKVFERFVRGDGDGRPRAGTGLGLAIVRAVAERHGGSVELSDGEGGGARFVVRLPAGAPGEREADGRRPGTEDGAAANGRDRAANGRDGVANGGDRAAGRPVGAPAGR